MLIDEIFEPLFMLNLGFPAVRLDKEKLIAAGHSFGGGTAVGVAFKDERVKCVMTLDPWLFPIHKDI